MAYTIPDSTKAQMNEAGILHDMRTICAKAERAGYMPAEDKAKLAELKAALKKERSRR